MTQLVLNIEDKSMLPGLRKILSNLNGVSIAPMPKANKSSLRKGTLKKAIEEVRNGQLHRASSVAELMADLEA